MSAPPEHAVRNLPIMATVAESYRTVFFNLPQLFRAALAPFLLTVAIGLLALAIEGSLLPLILSFVPYTLFGVAWYRFALLQPERGLPGIVPTWQRQHWRFLRSLALYSLIMFAIAIPVSLVVFMVSAGAGPDAAGGGQAAVVGVLAGLVSLAVLLYLGMRFAFVFPAVAVDEEYGFKHSWNHTRGQGLRLAIAVILAHLPIFFLFGMIGQWLLEALLSPSLDAMRQDGSGLTPEEMQSVLLEPGNFLAIQVFSGILQYILLALVVAFTAHAFRVTTGWHPGNGGAGPPAAVDESFDGRA